MAELIVTHEREERVTTRLVGRERRGASRPTQTEVQVREQITSVARDQVALARHKLRLGWRVQVTNLAQVRMPLAQAVRHYRGAWCAERGDVLTIHFFGANHNNRCINSCIRAKNPCRA
jgi:hypothetical protein